MRRNVPRVGAAYAIGAWLIVEVSSVVLPAFEAPDWLLRLVIVLALLGLPIALAGAWAFELTAEGLKRDEAVDRTEKLMRRPSPGRYAIASMIPLAIAGSLAIERILPKEISSANRGSIAVLPFENLTGDARNDPFTNGIHDDLLTHISRIASIKTISRTSVLQYRNTTKTIPEITKELGVTSVLEGGVQRSGDRLRINVQLIDATTDQHL